jgi:hypothetical protein
MIRKAKVWKEWGTEPGWDKSPRTGWWRIAFTENGVVKYIDRSRRFKFACHMADQEQRWDCPPSIAAMGAVGAFKEFLKTGTTQRKRFEPALGFQSN